MVHNVTDETFKLEVLESPLPVLVDFWAEWCGPCKMIAPILDEISNELKDKVKIAKINVDESLLISSSYYIRSIPTLILFKNGEQIAAKTGVLPKASLMDWIETSLK